MNSQAKEYELLSKELVTKIMDIFNKTDGWKLDKQQMLQQEFSINGDPKLNEVRIYTQSFSKIGKVFKLEAYIKYNYETLINVLRDDVDNYPKWNKSVKTSKVNKNAIFLVN